MRKPPVGTVIRFLVDLYDSDDKELMASAGSLGNITGYYEEHITATTPKLPDTFVVFSDEYEVVK